MQCACVVLLSVGCPALFHIFPHYLIKLHDFDKKLLNIKWVFWFSLQLLSETSLILRRTETDVMKSVCRSSCKVTVIFFRLMKLEFPWKIFGKKYLNIKFHENPSSGSRVIACGQPDGRIDGQTLWSQ